MESLAILGIVSNIVQLVDASTNAYRVCREVYQHGAAIEDARMSYTTTQLRESYSVLRNSLSGNSSIHSRSLESGVSLDDLSRQCCETAEQLQRELESLCKSSTGGLRRTISITTRKVLKAKKIDKLEVQLDEYKKVLDTKILIDIRQFLGLLEGQQEGHHADLEQQFLQLSTALQSCNISIAKDFRDIIDGAREANEKQHLLTRQYIEKQHLDTRQYQTAQNTEAFQGLQSWQKQHFHEQKQEENYHQQRERFIDSLTYAEINRRMNEVSESHPTTFEWIFDDDIERPWDSFSAWLRGNEHFYWINGKPGSGKSTLMKFVASDQRTRALLAQWSPKNEVMVVTYYLWLSGSKIQRSLKGLLCSVARQIFQNDTSLFGKIVDGRSPLPMKRNVDDWSVGEIQELLRRAVALTVRSLCVFVDGLDEFDQDDNTDQLLDLVEDLSASVKVKICVSSRPENYLKKRLSRYRQLKLQALTAKDINICIRDGLEKARIQCRPTSFTAQRFRKVVSTMESKSDGVFLWVHYALSSLIRGIRNDDNFNDLLDRIDELPSGMQQLYLKMWERLNGDQQRYRDEAAIYFSYGEYFSGENYAPRLSLFELLVALDESLQDNYIQSIERQDPAYIAERCQKLKTSILTRCAGLLEFYVHKDADISRSNSGDGTAISSRRSVESGESEIERNRNSNAKPSENFVTSCHVTFLRYIHRTAADFLRDTKEGMEILGNPPTSDDSRFRNIVRAEMASLIQHSHGDKASALCGIIARVGNQNSSHEIDLMTDLKPICMKLSPSESSQSRFSYMDHWSSFSRISVDYEGAAAAAGCCDFVRHVVEHENTYSSSYYLGYLLLCAAETAEYSLSPECRRLPLMSWLISQGADVFTSHSPRKDVFVPAATFLILLTAPNVTNNDRLSKQALELMQLLLPSVNESATDCSVFLARGEHWQMNGQRFHEDILRGFHDLVVNMSVIKLYHLVVHNVERRFPSGPRWERPQLRDEDIIRAEFCFGKANRKVSTSGWSLCRADSEKLGRTVDRILYYDPTSSIPMDTLTKDLESQLRDVTQRSLVCTYKTWASKAGWYIDKDRSIYGLDPAEDVNESNWLEKGYFRPPTERGPWQTVDWETDEESEIDSSGLE